MVRSKEECERLIRETPLFSINKENEPSRYQKEALKLVEYLYEYLISPKRSGAQRKVGTKEEGNSNQEKPEKMSGIRKSTENEETPECLLENQSKYVPYGMEIVEVAKRCIENFNPEAGVFLHYFVSAWSQEYKHILGREKVKQEFRGMHLAEEQIRKYRKYVRLVSTIAEEPESEEFECRMAEMMDVSREEVQKLVLMDKTRPRSNMAYNEDGEELDLLDMVDSGVYAEQRFFEDEEIGEFLYRIQAAFDKLQARQKPLIGKLLTEKMSLYAAENVKTARLLKEMSYFDKKIFVQCIKTGSEVEAKEISAKMGLAEASVSRSWKNFKEKLRETIVE